ncbi:MAG: DUF92 domain-containing protein [Acidobacteriota bacterium]|nr:DUF92 domain-containing protein [Acidobacteriota bacterium]
MTPSSRSFSEDRRQFLHMSMAAFALLLRVLTWEWALACALIALVFNVALLPRLGGRQFYRPADQARGYPLGIVFYPLAVAFLILVFPDRLDIVAGAWGVMAFGDGMATIAGRRAGSGQLPWNPEKTAAGLAAFVVCGGVGGALLSWWVRPAVHPVPSLAFALGAPIVAALVAGFAETAPIRLDDNLTVPAFAATSLWALSLMSTPLAAAAWPDLERALGPALIVNAVVGWAGWRLRTVSTPGAIVGGAIGVVIYACGGPAAWVLLLATFAAAAITSRLGLRRKVLLGIAEARGGRRGPGNAIANCGVAAGAAILSVLTPYAGLARLALVAALAAAGSDTVASEVGKAWGSRTFLITRLTRVRPGTSGAMSLEGTAAGLIAALLLAALGAAMGMVSWSSIWILVVGATAGSLVESVLGATVEASGLLDNDALNFINTAVSALVTLLLAAAPL